MAQYADFSITFGTATGGVFPVLVRSPAGPANGSFTSPVALEQIGTTLASVGNTVRGGAYAQRNVVPQNERSAPRDVPSDIGVQLFRSLFRGDVQRRFDESVGISGALGKVLRIRLHMNLDDRTVAPLASLPWELLHYEEKDRNLVQWPWTSVVRYLDVPHSNELPAFELPLRVLFVMANPRGDLNLARERREIESRLAQGGAAIESDVLERASYRSLDERLHGGRFHVVHFMGHGGFDGRDGVLLFEGGRGSGEESVKGRELATRLMQHRPLRLVVLNACRTAESVQNPEVDPYGGVAPALVMAGVPAVVAMQFPISDDGAIDFADRLYATLAAGGAIEEAVRHARTSIRHEWPTPVLFSRCDEALFDLPTAASPPATQRMKSVSAVASPSVAPSFIAAPTITADVPNLLPYMVDRTDLIYELEQAIIRQGEQGMAPLVAIIHGDDLQCQDKLQLRLSDHELPRSLRLDTRSAKILSYQQEWPDEYRDRNLWHQRLSHSLSRHTQHGAQPAEMQRFFAALPAPVMIHSHILASDWKRYGDAALDEYLAYWRTWPSDVGSQRLLVFLFIKYQVPEEGLFNAFSARGVRKANAALEASLARAAAAASNPGGVTLLPKLEGIKQSDVENWNVDHHYCLPVKDIEQMFKTHLAATRQTSMSMEVAGKMLHDLLSARIHASGGIA